MPEMEKVTATQYKVHQIIDNLDLSTAPLDVRLKIHIGTTDIATQEQVLALWIAHGDYIYTQSNFMHHYENNVEIEGGYLLNEWNNFIARNGENLLKAYLAMQLDYNPLNNYDLHEEIVNAKKRDSDTKTDTPYGKITNTTTQAGTDTTTTTEKRYGLDSVSGNNSDESTTTYTPTNRTTTTETTYDSGTRTDTQTKYENTLRESFDGTTISDYNETEKHLLKREGNVGVTSPVQMLSGELELRKNDLVRDFVHRFFCEYCYFVG